MTERQDNPESLLLRCIDRTMPIALQITLDKNKEPTFYNVLDVVAACCNDWFLALKSTGTFVRLSTGWTFVRQTNIVITDNSTMDEAVLHSLQSLSSFTKGVELADLSCYISVAFRFPAALSPNEIHDKVRCAIQSMKAWERVLIVDGRYRLPGNLVGSSGSKSEVSPSTSPVALTWSSINPKIKLEREVELDSATIISSEGVKQVEVLEQEFPEIFTVEMGESSASVSMKSHESSVEKSSREHEQSFVPLPEEPFLYASNCCRIIILFYGRKKISVGNGDTVRELLRKSNLRFARVIIAPTKPHMAFVEFEEVLDGALAIQKLNKSFQDRGDFQLIVEWARPNKRDFDDLEYASWRKQQQPGTDCTSRKSCPPPRNHPARRRSPPVAPRSERRRPRSPLYRRNRRSTSPVRHRAKRFRSRSRYPQDRSKHRSRSPGLHDREQENVGPCTPEGSPPCAGLA